MDVSSGAEILIILYMDFSHVVVMTVITPLEQEFIM